MNWKSKLYESTEQTPAQLMVAGGISKRAIDSSGTRAIFKGSDGDARLASLKKYLLTLGYTMLPGSPERRYETRLASPDNAWVAELETHTGMGSKFTSHSVRFARGQSKLAELAPDAGGGGRPDDSFGPVNPKKIQEMLVRERARMKDLLANGLHPVYKGAFADFLNDYYPDFSWNDHLYHELVALLADPEWIKLAEAVKAKYGYDFVKENHEAIQSLRSDY